MGTKGFVLYLLSGFSIAILSTFFISSSDTQFHQPLLSSLNSTLIDSKNGFGHAHIDLFSQYDKVWPKLEFNWRIVLATLIGFVGSAFGTVGGVGGGGIFVPMLNLIVGFDTKSAAALSKCMIMGASASSVWYNLRMHHPMCRYNS